MATAPIAFQDIITDSLLEINALTPGQPTNAADLAMGLARGNSLLDMWTARSLMQYVKRLDSYTFGTSKEVYTIGPQGADFTADRPVDILGADIVQNNNQPIVYIPVRIVDIDEWESLHVLSVSTSIPTILWYEKTFPNGKIHLYGQPSLTGYQLRIQTSQNLQQAASLTTLFSFPPAYYRGYMLSLAFDLCNPFGKRGEIVDRLQRKVQEAMSIIINVNAESPLTTMDSPINSGSGPIRPYFNWLTGDLS